MVQKFVHEILPERGRMAVYLAFAGLGVLIGCLGAGFDAAEVEDPVWLTVSHEVYLYAGGAFGVLAAGNVPARTPGRREAIPTE